MLCSDPWRTPTINGASSFPICIIKFLIFLWGLSILAFQPPPLSPYSSGVLYLLVCQIVELIVTMESHLSLPQDFVLFLISVPLPLTTSLHTFPSSLLKRTSSFIKVCWIFSSRYSSSLSYKNVHFICIFPNALILPCLLLWQPIYLPILLNPESF